MKIHADGRVERTDIWREGAWVDLWSAVHFISGICVGLALYLLRLDPLAALSVATVLLIAYEVWEAKVKIEETPANRFMDVVIGMASLVPTYLWLAPNLSILQIYGVLVVFLALDALMSALGWHASHKAAELEKRMRAGILRMRERRAMRRAQRRM